MPGTADHPFTGPPVEAILLNPPPLERVLTQIRFASVLAVADEAFAGQVQQRLREEYPFVRGEIEMAFVMPFAVPPAEGPQGTPTRLWRFFSDVEETWRVTLATNFVSLETTDYRGHDDYFDRLGRLLAVVQELVAPPQVERTGVRYIQRIAGQDDLHRLAEYVRPEVLGASALQDAGAEVGLCLTQMQSTLEDVQITARWGLLPPNGGIDGALPPVAEQSWVMDIDVFDAAATPFDGAALVERALQHSRRQYRFFRWAVEPAFLLRFGADPAAVAELTGGASA